MNSEQALEKVKAILAKDMFYPDGNTQVRLCLHRIEVRGTMEKETIQAIARTLSARTWRLEADGDIRFGTMFPEVGNDVWLKVKA